MEDLINFFLFTRYWLHMDNKSISEQVRTILGQGECDKSPWGDQPLHVCGRVAVVTKGSLKKQMNNITRKLRLFRFLPYEGESNVLSNYQGLCSRVLGPLSIIYVEVDSLRLDEATDQLNAKSTVFSDPICGKDYSTTERTIPSLYSTLTIHSGSVKSQLKGLSTLCMAVHIVCKINRSKWCYTVNIMHEQRTGSWCRYSEENPRITVMFQPFNEYTIYCVYYRLFDILFKTIRTLAHCILLCHKCYVAIFYMVHLMGDRSELSFLV